MEAIFQCHLLYGKVAVARKNEQAERGTLIHFGRGGYVTPVKLCNTFRQVHPDTRTRGKLLAVALIKTFEHPLEGILIHPHTGIGHGDIHPSPFVFADIQ